MDEALIQVAVQVPALLLVSYVFLELAKRILDVQGTKLDRLADAVDKLEQHLRSGRHD